MTRFKLGRLPRAHSLRVPHLRSLVGAQALPPPPPAVDWTQGMPSNLGLMLNDRLGDCTAAAAAHAIQVWSYNAAGAMMTEPDSAVLALYEGSTGYDPADPSTDQGGVEQDVLAYLVNTGIGAHKLAAFVEVDHTDIDDVKRTIADCGVAYIGFNVPGYMPEEPGSVWDVQHGGDQSIQGGHAVVLAGYDDHGFVVISWGAKYTMTPAFFARYCDEVYALADAEWVRATGLTPGGLSLADLEAHMQALKAAA